MPKIQILPSVLAADMGRLAEECRRAEAAGADALHVDIMDGHFVGNLSMGPDIVKAIRKAVQIPLSVHLMVSRPDHHAPAFLEAGSDLLLIHIEAEAEPAPVLNLIRNRGRRAGITLNPETPLHALDGVLDLVDEVLFMTVHPGFGGQSFIPQVLDKMKALRAQRPQLDLSVDGGINQETARAAAAAGCNALIAGTFLFRAKDMAAEIRNMRTNAEAVFRTAVT